MGPDAGFTLLRWCATQGVDCRTMRDLVRGFVDQVLAVGVPIRRLNLTLRTLHPLFVAENYVWRYGREEIDMRRFSGGDRAGASYKVSPLRPILDGETRYLRHPITAETAAIYPLFVDYAAQGMTDYIAAGLTAEPDLPIAMSLMTDQPGGLNDEQLRVLRDGFAGLRPLIELFMQREIARSICVTYIGKQTGHRVLKGEINRGSVESLHAVLWFCDLRGFTPLTLQHGTQGIVNLLNGFFGVIGEAVEQNGGEILKFVGDAALAIFPLQPDAAHTDACDRALHAAVLTHEKLAARAAADGPTLEASVALHVGEVSYGNIGAPDRLDFTVIGAAVNLTARLSQLSATLHEPIVASRAFADRCARPLRGLGTFALKGIAEPQEAFGVG